MGLANRQGVRFKINQPWLQRDLPSTWALTWVLCNTKLQKKKLGKKAPGSMHKFLNDLKEVEVNYFNKGFPMEGAQKESKSVMFSWPVEHI